MNRFRLNGLLMLAFFLTGCGQTTNLSAQQFDMALQTLTATALPPTVTPTPNPDESAIVLLLNRGLNESIDPLSQTLDARYQAVDVSFPLGASQLPESFLVQVRCECAFGGVNCCTPERTFVVVVTAMQTTITKIATQVPNSVINFQVSCSNQNAWIGTMSVAWRDLLEYYSGNINGFQLGARSVRLAGP